MNIVLLSLALNLLATIPYIVWITHIDGRNTYMKLDTVCGLVLMYLSYFVEAFEEGIWAVWLFPIIMNFVRVCELLINDNNTFGEWDDVAKSVIIVYVYALLLNGVGYKLLRIDQRRVGEEMERKRKREVEMEKL